MNDYPFSAEIIRNYGQGVAVSIDTGDLGEALNKQRVDFVTINVQGREIQTLSGLRRVLLDNPHIKLLITCNPRIQKAMGQSPEELLNSLYNLGFEVYLLDEQKRKFYRLHDNKHSFLELLGTNIQGNLLCMSSSTSLLISHLSHMADMTGAEKSLIAQIEELKNKDVLSHIVVPQEGVLTSHLRKSAVSYDVVHFRWWGNIKVPTLAHIAESLQEISHYARELEKINPHIIYTNTLTIPWGAFLAYLLHKPHVWHIKEFGEKDHGFKFILDFSEIKKIIIQMSDFIIFNSKTVEKEFKKNLMISQKQAKTLYYNIRIGESEVRQKVKTLYKNENSLKLIIVGGVFETKGQLEAIMAVHELNKQKIPVDLVILGDLNENSFYYKKLVQTINNYHLTNVSFEPKVANPYPFMKQAHILLVCSRREAFGKVTIEGMLLKKLVIGANSGGTQELIQVGRTGYLYKQGDVADLVEKLIKIYNNKHLILTIGRRAQKYALTHFSNNSYIEDIYQLFLNMRSEKPTIKESVGDYVGKLLQYFSEHKNNDAKNIKDIQKKQTRLRKVISRLRGY